MANDYKKLINRYKTNKKPPKGGLKRSYLETLLTLEGL